MFHIIIGENTIFQMHLSNLVDRWYLKCAFQMIRTWHAVIFIFINRFAILFFYFTFNCAMCTSKFDQPFCHYLYNTSVCVFQVILNFYKSECIERIITHIAAMAGYNSSALRLSIIGIIRYNNTYLNIQNEIIWPWFCLYMKQKLWAYTQPLCSRVANV